MKKGENKIEKRISHLPDRVARKLAIVIVTIIACVFVLYVTVQFFFGSEVYDVSKYESVGDGQYAKGWVLDGGKVIRESD